MSFRDAIEVLGVEATRRGYSAGEQYEARTPLGTVLVHEIHAGWGAMWWPARQRRAPIQIVHGEARSPADAAREATRRLRAIQRTCARAGAV